MKVIAGLGNPGRDYARTPHNAGFRAVDALAASLGASWRSEPKYKAEIARATCAAGPLLLVKPQTFMNLSGDSLAPLLGFYKVPAGDLVVVSDEVNLPPGRVRVRPGGSAGGHNGLKNIILHLGTDEFTRIRIGVGGKPAPGSDLANHVLGHFSSEDRPVIEEAFEKAADAVECAIGQGPDKAMNLYNTKKQKKQKKQKKETEAAETVSEVGENADNNSAAEGI
jgi:PTH1 family peptidyl-tRNA hydrolase